MSKSLDGIRNDYKKASEMSCQPTNMRKVPLGYIFDKSKSVSWNEEQVQLNHKNYQEEVYKLKSEKQHCMEVVLEDIYRAIQEEMPCYISRMQAMIIWDYAYNMGHSGGVYEIFSQLDDLMDFVESLLINK